MFTYQKSLARIAAIAAAILSLPAILSAYSSNPPLRLTGAPGEGTCLTCHSNVGTGSGVSVAFPGGLTYTPGVAMTLAVTAPGGNGGFELSTRVASGNTQAGTLGSGANSGTALSSAIQYAFHTTRSASWAVPWTPPATNVGNVMVYVTGVNQTGTFTASYTLTPATAPPPPPIPTITASPATLTFNYSGAPLSTQSVQVASSGAAVSFNVSAATTTGGNWLSATPATGSTPMGVTVTANPAGLAAGQYAGTVTIASTGASNSPRTVGVTLNVSAAPPPPSLPQLTLSATTLSFDAISGSSQSLQVKASDGSAQAFTAAATTNSGGPWLAVTPLAGSTPATATVTVNTAGLADGTYTGAVKFTSGGVSNSPRTVTVTLKIATAPPPPPSTQPDPLKFTFSVLDSHTGGTDTVLLDGAGAIDDTGKLTGSGRFTVYMGSGTGAAEEDDNRRVLATGRWKATGLVNFTPTGSNPSDNGGVLEINATWTPMGGKSVPATFRIAATGTESGVTVTVGPATYAPTGTGHVSILLKGRQPVDGDTEDDSNDDH